MLSGFDAQASGAILDLTGDDDQMMRAKKNCVKWDAKKRKYVKADQVTLKYLIEANKKSLRHAKCLNLVMEHKAVE
jgi:hypothetical protein